MSSDRPWLDSLRESSVALQGVLGALLEAERHFAPPASPLERLRQTTPITVLLGEQNVTFALPHADRVYVLEHARIVWEGDPGRFAEEAGEGYL